MECRFCKLRDIENVEKNVYHCNHCGYSFEASKWDIFYDTLLHMPLSSWLVASLLWGSAMLTGIVFGVGFNSKSLSITTLFLYLYGITAVLYGGSKSSDYFQAIWLYFTQWIRRKNPQWNEILEVIRKRRKEKMAKKSTASVVATSGTHIETDIRPSEMRIPYLSASFKAGLITTLFGVIFSIVYGVIFASSI